MKIIVLGVFGLITCLVLFLSSWIVLPAPTYAFLVLSVGAPEISPGLLGLSVLLLLLFMIWYRQQRRGLQWKPGVMLACIILSLVLSSWPLQQFAGTIRRADTAIAAVTSSAGLQNISSDKYNLMRSQPLIWQDLWRGVAGNKVRVDRQIPFAKPDGVQLNMNIYRPAQVGKYPGIISIYGGAWQRGNPDSDDDFNRYMAAQGYVVWAIDYRHAPVHRFPAQLDDVRSALGYIKAQAVNWETDLNRMAAIGRSAGAQLAMLAAYDPTEFPLRAVVDYYGPVNLTSGYYNPPVPDPIDSKAVLLAFFGGNPRELPESYHQASPINAVKPGLPASLLIYGGKDRIVEAKYGQYLANALTTQGNKVVFIEIPWADHAFDEVFSGLSNQLALYYTERFLAGALMGRA